MNYRKLRMAWSVLWGVAAVLLIVLWVRSYWWYDALYVRQDNGTRSEVASAQGEIRWGKEYMWGFTGQHDGLDENRFSWIVRSKLLSDPALIKSVSLDYPTIPTYRGLIFRDDYNHTYVPHWCLILVFGSLAATSWLPCRFSLRTMLVATTLIAVVLGLIACAAR